MSNSRSSSERRCIFKTVIVGERAVGKTSLALRYIRGTFSMIYSVTVGIEFYSKIIARGEENYNLQLWDTVAVELLRPARKVSSHL
jgi:GTPase SAR1 family protein